MTRRAIYAGSFDPITLGHVDIIRRASRMFDELIVAIAENAAKQPFLEISQRLQLIEACCQQFSHVRVASFEGLLIEFAKQQEVKVLVRGLRTGSDLHYEAGMVAMNRQMAPEIETVFLSAAPEVAHISATLARDVIQHQGNVRLFVPEEVAQALGH